ncbi:hypothetical protein RhiirC2_797655 [Rhizophagus irregularis]|uniref:Reverse transcriptase domain-containing protein n=1 Tax=Rhizophagus irregularis TaxID=588596 RepID=A0A2N1M7R9_9GLOM|nr:hypothetical protein RhiirC2_797655 [Rhizophagus irregularis]
MLDPYVLLAPSLIASQKSSPDLHINNLVFMDDSTLVSLSKIGMEFMLSITEEFYQINNTSANHNKYVLITNSLPLNSTSTLSPVTFNLELFSLNRVPSITIAPIFMTTSFRFLDVVEAPVIPETIESSVATVFANSPLIPSADSRYIFFTDGSLINLGTSDVSMGWS